MLHCDEMGLIELGIKQEESKHCEDERRKNPWNEINNGFFGEYGEVTKNWNCQK